MLETDKIPVAMVLPKKESKTAQHKCTKQTANLNQLGWKICHIDPVGIGKKGIFANIPMETLKQHFRKYMSPHNMFLVPKQWAGLGEMPEMIKAAQEAARASD